MCLPAPPFPAPTVPPSLSSSSPPWSRNRVGIQGLRAPRSCAHPAPVPCSTAGWELGRWRRSSPGRRLVVLPHPAQQEIGPQGPELPLLLPRWAKPGPWALQRETLEDSLEIINPGMARAEPSCPMTPCLPGTGHTPKFLSVPTFPVALPPSWTRVGHIPFQFRAPPKIATPGRSSRAPYSHPRASR